MRRAGTITGGKMHPAPVLLLQNMGRTMDHLVLLLIPLLLLSCGHRENKEERPKSSSKVELSDVRREVVATGAVKPKVGAQVKVGSRISGKLEQLMVQAGDHVEQGRLIAVVEHRDLEARVERLNATLKGLKIRNKEDLQELASMIRESKAKLKLARLDLKRYSALLKKGYVATADVDKAQRDVKVLSAQLAAAERKYQSTRARYAQEIAQTRAQLKEASVYLSYAFIKAPITGTVSSVTTQQGETVVAGLNAPTFITIIDLARLQVDGFVDETDIGKVQPGQPVEFTVDAYPNRTVHGHVKTIYPGAIIRDNVVYYDVVVEIDDPFQGILRPEMTANLTFITGIHKGVPAIPDKSIRMDTKGREYVLVKEDGSWKKRHITTGWSSGGYTEVKDGLKPGEEVALW